MITGFALLGFLFGVWRLFATDVDAEIAKGYKELGLRWAVLSLVLGFSLFIGFGAVAGLALSLIVGSF